MSNQELWPLAVGAVMPIVIAIIKQANWSKRARAAVALLVCVLGGFGTAWYAGQLTPRDIGKDVMLVIIAAQAFYRGVLKPLGWDATIEATTQL